MEAVAHMRVGVPSCGKVPSKAWDLILRPTVPHYSRHVWTSHSNRSRICTCSFDRERQGGYVPTQRRPPPAPPAPPLRLPPPPMPPPPPRPPSQDAGLDLPRRGALLALMFGGAAVWWNYLQGQMPEVYHDANGHPYFRTKGGAPVSIMEDELGNIFMKDPGGNIYYDTGDQKLGVYLMDRQGNMFNLFMDADGTPQRLRIGNINDLVPLDSAKEIGGVPVRDLQNLFKGKAKRLLAFPADPLDLPPSTPATVNKDGTISPPTFLEEGYVRADEKRRLWPFGNDRSDDGGKFKRGIE